MKKTFLFLSLLFALTIYSSGCSSRKTAVAAESTKNNAASSENAGSENGISGSEQIAFDPNSNREGASRSGAYNSLITVSLDGSGNKIENRYFDNHSRVAFLLITTHVKGEQQVTVFGKDGRNRSIALDKFNDIMSASPDEIADAAGILESVKPVMPPLPDVPTIEPIQAQTSSVPAALVEGPTVETAATETVQASLPPVEVKSTPVQQAKQSVDESGIKDNLKPY